MSKIIIFSHIELTKGGFTSGLAQRNFWIAKSLLKLGHEITIAEKTRISPEKDDKINYLPWKHALKEIRRYDVAIIQIWANDTAFLEEVSKIPLVVDIFAPYMIEHIYHNYRLRESISRSRFKNDVLTASFNPFFYGDFFICATERQKNFYTGMLTSFGRITPFTKKINLIAIVPYGIDSTPKPTTKKSILKENPKLKNKKIIIWHGTFYPWYDPITAIDSAELISEKYPEYVLVFLGCKNPRVPRYLTTKIYKNAVSQAKKKGLLGKSIFFIDWLDYETFQSALSEAEFAMLTYYSSLESELSYRIRTVETFRANIPLITTEGDYFSEIINEKKLGLTFPEKDPAKIKEAAIKLIKSEKQKIKFKENIKKYVSEYLSSPDLIKPLDDFCKKPHKDSSKQVFSIYHMIQDNRDELTYLRKNNDEKQFNIGEKKGHIRNLEAGIRARDNEISALKNETDSLNKNLSHLKSELEKQQAELNKITAKTSQEIELSQKRIYDLELELGKLNSEITALKSRLNEKEQDITKMRLIIGQQRQFLGKYQASIIYPFYRLTSSIGETSMGKLLQKVLK